MKWSWEGGAGRTLVLKRNLDPIMGPNSSLSFSPFSDVNFGWASAISEYRISDKFDRKMGPLLDSIYSPNLDLSLVPFLCVT